MVDGFIEGFMPKPRTVAGRTLLILLAQADIRWPDEHTRISVPAISRAIVDLEAVAAGGLGDELPGIFVKDVATCAKCGALLDKPPEAAAP